MEQRLIDANAIKLEKGFFEKVDNVPKFYEWLVKQPTVDAVPVVRCKDCKWAEVDAWWTYCKLGHKEDTTNSIIYTCTHDFYCADGERIN